MSTKRGQPHYGDAGKTTSPTTSPNTAPTKASPAPLDTGLLLPGVARSLVARPGNASFRRERRGLLHGSAPPHTSAHAADRVIAHAGDGAWSPHRDGPHAARHQPGYGPALAAVRPRRPRADPGPRRPVLPPVRRRSSSPSPPSTCTPPATMPSLPTSSARWGCSAHTAGWPWPTASIVTTHAPWPRPSTDNRCIGAAIGIVMGRHRLTQDQAFSLLRRTSQNSNRKLGDIADDVLYRGDISR